MTIIRPYDNQKKIFNLLIITLGVFAAGFIVIGITMYGALVGLQHDIQRTQQKIQEEQLASTKIQNQMYGITDVLYLEKKVIEMGLLKERNPEYLNKKSTAEAEVQTGSRSL